MWKLLAGNLQLVLALPLLQACGPGAGSTENGGTGGSTSAAGETTAFTGSASGGIEPGRMACGVVHVGDDPLCFELIPTRWTVPFGDADGDGRTDGAQQAATGDPIVGARSDGMSFVADWELQIADGRLLDGLMLDGAPHLLARTSQQLFLYGTLGSTQPTLVQTTQLSGEALQGFSYFRPVDTDGDGDQDLVFTTESVGNAAPKLHIVENLGASLLGAPVPVGLPALPDGVAVSELTLVEFDGDGALDYAVNIEGAWNIYFNDGTDVWSTPLELELGDSLGLIRPDATFIDIDLDGRSDVLEGAQGRLAIEFSEGRAPVTELVLDFSTLVPMFASWLATPTVVNLDSDPQPEIVVQLYVQGGADPSVDIAPVFILDEITRNGIGVVHELALPICPGTGSSRGAPLDFDGDGNTDVIVDASGDCEPVGATLLLNRN